MKRPYPMFSMVPLALLAAGLTTGQNDAWTAYEEALAEAEQLNVTYTVNEIGGGVHTVQAEFSKPNRARVTTPRGFFVADGTTVSVFDRAENHFYSRPQTDEILWEELRNEPTLAIYTRFFGEQALTGMERRTGGSTVNRAGRQLVSLQATLPANQGNVQIFVDPETHMPKQALWNITQRPARELVINADNVAMTGVSASRFAFAAPDGARQVNYADLMASQWIEDPAEGFRVAQQRGGLTLMHFTATWCQPCRMMERDTYSTEAFKTATRGMTLVKVDIDKHPNIARDYGVNAVPTIVFVERSGREIHRFTGFRPASDFVTEVNTAKRQFGG